MAKSIRDTKVISGEAWIIFVLKKLGIDPTLVSRVVIDALPGEPLKFHITHLGTENLLDVRSPEVSEVEIHCSGAEK